MIGTDGYEGLLTAVLDALCNPLIKLRNTFPITYSPETETRCKNLSPTENLSVTTSMIQAGDTSTNRYYFLRPEKVQLGFFALKSTSILGNGTGFSLLPWEINIFPDLKSKQIT